MNTVIWTIGEILRTLANMSQDLEIGFNQFSGHWQFWAAWSIWRFIQSHKAAEYRQSSCNWAQIFLLIQMTCAAVTLFDLSTHPDLASGLSLIEKYRPWVVMTFALAMVLLSAQIACDIAGEAPDDWIVWCISCYECLVMAAILAITFYKIF